ncbi:DUF262 domain-containing protein [Acinetobacter sp. AHP123]|uniref:DUF262 domain-containing protein n=1 Tax=Acinetobacter sp. AHP123 TaxID=2913495 RepID=UPI0020753E54|nr:DUF262 domain-containing protein [Acinetobacter sp. AHP123]
MDLKSIHAIFTDRILRIPSYQRGYSWTNDAEIKERKDLVRIKGQLMDLWNDIQNIPNDKWHYTGLLTLAEHTSPDYKEFLPRKAQYSIVDGQQRITSILILITVLVKYSKQFDYEFGDREGDTEFHYLYISKGTRKAYIFGYDQDNPSDKYFRKNVLGLDEIEGDSKESIYTENLIKARKFFEKAVGFYLEDASNKVEALQFLFDKVTTGLRLNEYILPNELDEYVVFETMNNRGKPLSQLEKLKNRLMYLIDKMSLSLDDKNELIKSVNTAWITIYQSLGAEKSAPLDDDDFIKAHWIMYFGQYDRSESNVYAQHLFNHYFTIERVYGNELTALDILKYVKSLQKSSIYWNQIHYPKYFEDADDNVRIKILGLHRVGFRAAFKPLILAILHNKDKFNLFDICTRLEKFAFKVFHAADRQSNTGDSKLYRLSASVYSGEIDSQAICDSVETYTKEYYSFTKFKNLIEYLVEEKKGFYKWSGLKYIFFEYDQFLRAKNKVSAVNSQLIWQDFKNRDSIEHIYPQSASQSLENFCNGDNSSERKSTYDELQLNWHEFSIFTEGERKRLCNSLGNLLAITHSDNSSMQNDPFRFKADQSEKGSQYRNRGYKYDSLSAQIVANESIWSPDHVKNRGLEILDFILLKLDEDQNKLSIDEKVALLGLDFLINEPKSLVNSTYEVEDNV